MSPAGVPSLWVTLVALVSQGCEQGGSSVSSPDTGVDGALRDPSGLARVRRQLGVPTVTTEGAGGQ